MESVGNVFGIRLIRVTLNLATTLQHLPVVLIPTIMNAAAFAREDTFKSKVNASPAHKTHSTIILLVHVSAILVIISLESKY